MSQVSSDVTSHSYTLSFSLVGEHSKITLNTRNVFIESTATDLHKVTLLGSHR